MKRILIPLILILATINAYSVEEVISYWNKQGSFVYYQDAPWQFARFDLAAPCYIKKITIYFSGQAGSAQVFLCGQEAGSPLPEVFSATNGRKLLAAWAPANITPPSGQAQAVNFTLSSEGVFTNSNQVFVGIGNISQGLFVLSDQREITLPCQSEDGGNYYYQSFIGSDRLWHVGGYAYCVDLTVEYPTKTSNEYFKDVTADKGLLTNLSSSTVAAADFDEDGYQDLLISGKLYKNNAGVSFTDITAAKGLSGSPIGNAIIDLNNDGALDILFLMQGAGSKSKIYMNDGTGNFTEKTLKLPELNALTCFSIADINKDKFPDIFLGQLWGTYPQPYPNYFYIADNGDFKDATTMIYPQFDGTWNYPNAEWDPDNNIVERNRNSRGSQWVDFDNDGDLDLYVTNYFLQADEFYRNNGDGTFNDILAQKKIDLCSDENYPHDHGTGVDWYDFDNDGDMDLLLSQFNHPRNLPSDHRGTTIYKNLGAPNFDFENTYDTDTWSSKIGIEYEETHSGAAWGDANNDGLSDFVITTYYGCRYIDFYLQKPDHKFESKTFEWGLDKIVTGEDACWVDFNNDGKLDLAMSKNRQFRLFENKSNFGNNFIQLDLEGNSEKGLKSYITGARVQVFTGSDTYTQEVSCGRGQKMQKPYRLHFGLGSNSTIDKVEVRWPNQAGVEEFYDVQANQIVKLIQGTGTSVEETGSSAEYFYLSENAPNPLSNYTVFEFGLPVPEYVTLRIFNTAGQMLEQVISKQMEPGIYKIRWESGALQSGVYYYQIVAGKYSNTRKMVVLK